MANSKTKKKAAKKTPPSIKANVAPDFAAMTGKEMDAFGESSGMTAPEGWVHLDDEAKRAHLIAAFEADKPTTKDDIPHTADPPSYDMTDAVRRFKERRLRMSVRDILALACALGVRDWQNLAYDQLRKRMRIAIRDARND